MSGTPSFPYQGPPNEYVNIWKMSNGDVYTFVRGIAITQQYALKLLDDSGDLHLKEHKKEYGFANLTVREIFELRQQGDDDAGDFFHNLFTVPISGAIELYVDEIRRGIDDGPVILGIQLAEFYDSAFSGFGVDNKTDVSRQTATERVEYITAIDTQLKIIANRYGFPPKIDIYVINTT
jgi:hypothetical protein